MQVAGVKVKYDNTGTKARNSECTNIVAKNILGHESFIHCLQDKGHIFHDLALVTILVIFLLLQVRYPPPHQKRTISHFQNMSCVRSHSVVSNSFETPWTIAHWAPLSMGIIQARILEWVDLPSSRASSRPRDWTQVSHMAGGFFTIWATREAQEYWRG